MNLQTGEKEAKLMDGDDGSRYQKTKDAKQKFITIDKNLISKQHLKEALKDFRDKFHDKNPHGEDSEELQNRVNASVLWLMYFEQVTNSYVSNEYYYIHGT